MPDLQTVYEDISITSEFKIDDIPEFSEAVNESKIQKVIYEDDFGKYFVYFYRY